MSELRDEPLHANSSEAVTKNVRVEVESQYAPEHSQPFQREWFFHYTVRISNEGDETVQLLTPPLDHHRRDRPHRRGPRRGRRRRAAGARGRASRSSTTSGCPLKTSTGVMRGTYQMVTEDGDHFDVEIAPFALHEPYTVH